MENCPSNRNPVVAPLSVLMYALARKTTPRQSQDKTPLALACPAFILCHIYEETGDTFMDSDCLIRSNSRNEDSYPPERGSREQQRRVSQTEMVCRALL